MGPRTFAIFIAILAVIGLLAYGFLSEGTPRLEAGEPVPATELERLGAAGTGSIADYRGSWLLVNVWASWCTPCEAEAPDLRRFDRRHGDRDEFAIVGIDTQDGTEPALEFVAEHGLDYDHLRDPSGTYSRDELGTTGVPESFLVDPDGNLALHAPGVIDAAWLENEVAPRIEGGE
ncbi:MAG TPA: redoxin domain-containing protein [Solirubrobacterales bacterium]|nr:redoxin domain-containing protein [Solirubrobacterales bacterium]